MTDLARLKVSTTKFGAAKLAGLLEKYDKDEVPAQAAKMPAGDKIDAAVVRATLSVTNGKVPEVWNSARELGPEAIHGLLFLAIIFSHHEYIDRLRKSKTGPFCGMLHRPGTTDTENKKYTNAARVIEASNYGVERTKTSISYDLTNLFNIKGLNILAKELFGLKLATARWDHRGSVEAEVLRLKLNETLAITPEQFSNWLKTGSVNGVDEAGPENNELVICGLDDELPEEDVDYFLDTCNAAGLRNDFEFTPGHKPRHEGTVPVTPSKVPRTASRFHNKLQTKLYNDLVAIYGKKCVGTEQATGQGTSIDVVVKTETFCWFYEIKVGKTLKACIRQALPQLLEYAYWRDDDDIAHRLIIASKFEITEDAETFMELLRTRFGLPLHYMQTKL